MFLLIIEPIGYLSQNHYFNTSHVSINRISSACFSGSMSYFNTSHVSINRASRFFYQGDWIISIHLMFLLIFYCPPIPILLRYFNTSHVSINPEAAAPAAEASPAFQYISCFY